MKILHTSDWHLGQELYSFDRTEEHIAFLEQIKDIIIEECPDAMLVSGDIFHNASPSNFVMKLFYDYLLTFKKACPTMKIVATAGNHDSCARLESTHNIMKEIGIDLIGHIDKQDNMIDFDRHIIPINDNAQNTIGYIVAMPHVYPQAFPLVNEDTSRGERQVAFLQALNSRLNEINISKHPVVMMAHMAISGSDITGHDLSRGGMDYIDISDIPVDFDYLALGHIHCPQNINGGYARYCGTPIDVSFDENYEHSVSIVDIEANNKPIIRPIKINNPIPLVTIPKEAASFKDVLNKLADIDNDERMYIRLNIKYDDSVPRLVREQAIEVLKDKQARFCTIKWEREQTATRGNQQAQIATEEMLAKSPLEIAQIHFERIYNSKMGQDMIDKLNEVINIINSQKS